ncbi:MAG: hypothetical protein Kapaf2KO_21740 [Candidatus Kapaibacteriales bacterium]
MKKLTLILVFLLGTQLFYSQRNLSLQEAIEISLENNHNIELVEYDQAIAEQDVREAYGYAMPSVNFNASYQRNVILQKLIFGEGGQTSFFPPELIGFIGQVANQVDGVSNPFANAPTDQETEPVTIGLRNGFTTTVELNQPIFNYAVFQGVGSAKTYKGVADIQVDGVKSKTIKDTKSAYYSALLLKESVELVVQSAANAQKRYEDISVLYDNGLISEYDQLRAGVQVDNLKSEILNSRTNFQNALNGLKITIGVPVDEEIELSENLSDFASSYSAPSADEAKAEIKTGNYDLLTLEESVKVQDAFVDLEQASFYPTLGLFANYNFQGQSNDFDFTTFDQSAVGLRLNWNVFQGFQRSAKLEKAKLNKEKAETQLDLLSRSLQTQGEIVSLKMETAQEQIAAGNKTVAQAERGYEIANTRYQEGVGSLLEINDADLALRQAKLNRLQAVYNYLNAQAEFENLKGNK